ncbi:nitronate monooxygenase family protein [Gammaproteobacteria bacterium]|jgi:NAD(P)H-dependent flavin oxidoreductase YrpB (nitropropane dioxygenase family)|nr:nitronate monooxygenase family protein [Gammaproteobacteria bacterium]MDA9947205.1 nitronate monooxygenase family protein [bacterium]MDA8709079.1 nitronate monooxygenase family protein [Gammaproteobacteria bacterium]MDA8780717.1 nitronate monooxygenase family protein [Gammaproteobacteria bacterium]MDA8798960.1 nitronate monooxygenase family protein [Gammaproteobacteria bacterium]
MKTDICKKLGIEYPIFAFTHCRDVVVAVSKAGGIGVLGAVGYSPEQLKEELDWIDEHIGEYPYGVDTVIPQKYEGMDEKNPEQLLESLQKMIPDGHRKFVEDLLSANGVPEAPETNGPKGGLLGWTEATAEPQIEEALKHQNVKLIANALGTPPADMIKKIQDKGVLIGALCGKIKQAVAHKEAGLDFIIAQGGEGGGHTGEIGSIVLWPQIVDAVDGLPVLAAGGIGNGRQMAAAMSTGVQGVWCGSLWLAVEEAAAQPAEKDSYLNATSEDTIRSKAWTGKPARMLKNKWTEAWENPENPDPLPMPLQGMITFDAMRRTSMYASSGNTQEVSFNAAGQVIGQVKQVESVKDVIYRMINEYLDSVERLNELLPKE